MVKTMSLLPFDRPSHPYRPRHCLRNDPASLPAKSRAAAGIAAVSGSRQVVFRRVQLIQQHLGHRFEAVRYKFSIEGGGRWQGHFVHFFNFVNRIFVQFQRFVNLFCLA